MGGCYFSQWPSREVKSCSNHTIFVNFERGRCFVPFLSSIPSWQVLLQESFPKVVRNILDFFPGMKDSGLSVSSKTMGGMFANGRCRRKWFGVRVSSFTGWSLTWVSGREFNISSVSAIIVVKNSGVSFWYPRTIRSDRFAVWIILSQGPPK